jgi:methionyl-tRNA formyltransferase
MLFYPGMRSLAYLNAFEKSGVFPQEIVALAGEIPHQHAILLEAESHNYRDQYFDVTIDPGVFCQDHGIIYTIIDATSINDSVLIDYLNDSPLTTWIFSGGGILREKILSLGKQFVHVHPGRLPAYRGSTTFYYSLLEENSLHATAFIMGAEIDEGPVLADGAFGINVRIDVDQPHFMDAILDPFIRAKVLELFLKRETPIINSLCQQKPEAREPYFIIHPLLRSIVVSRLNRMYRADIPEGIYLLEKTP